VIDYGCPSKQNNSQHTSNRKKKEIQYTSTVIRLDPVLHTSQKGIFFEQDERFASFIDY
jgi:hypothetical protein